MVATNKIAYISESYYLCIEIMKTFSKRYPIFIIIVISLAITGCKSHKNVINKTPDTHLSIEEYKKEEEGKLHLSREEKKVIDEALEWEGTPYKYGEETKGVCTDCSGMVMRVFEKSIGCKLPRNSAKQAEFCEKIHDKDIKPGDLVFFITNNGNKINHVGIMVDRINFIHASSKGVIISSMEANYYKTHFKEYGRVPCLEHH